MKNGKSTWSIICCICLAGIFYGCAPTVKNPTSVSKLSAEEASSMPEVYRIRPGDVLDIKFFYQPELNEQVTVRPDGRISLQLAHEVPAAEKTPDELTRELVDRYSRELKDPEITVIVRSFSAHRVYVGGEVNDPQLIPLEGMATVLQAIFQAGGLKDTARTKEVVLIRRAMDNTPMTIPLNLKGVIDGTDVEQDLVLRPYDIIYVPKTPIADLNLWVEQYLHNIILKPDLGFSYRLN